MRKARLALALLALAATVAFAAQTQEKPPKPLPLKTKVGTFNLEVQTGLLGLANKKTVVRIRLTAPELSREANTHGIKSFRGLLKGGFRQAENDVDSFEYPVTADMSGGLPFSYSFLRQLPP